MPRVLRQVPEISFETALAFFQSGNREEFFIGLTVLFRKHINNTQVWDLLIEYFRKSDATEIPPILIYYFAHVPWHGDIVGIGEMPTKMTKEYVQAIFNTFGKSEIDKLLSIVDEEGMISRGSVGQSVEAVVSSLENCSALLKSILNDKDTSLHVREVAAIILAMHWPDAAIEQLQALVTEGSWYASEIIHYINEWGAFDPYA